MGISVRQPKDKQIAAVYKLTKSTAATITEKAIGVEKVIVDDGYGCWLWPAQSRNIRCNQFDCSTEGVLLDPVYSGKGLAGMIGLIGQKFFDTKKDVLFLHTGGRQRCSLMGVNFRLQPNRPCFWLSIACQVTRCRWLGWSI